VDPDAVEDGEWGRSRYGCIRWGLVIVEGEWAVLGLNSGRHIVTNGDLRRGSSQITLGSICSV